jgi:hypothetical protein
MAQRQIFLPSDQEHITVNTTRPPVANAPVKLADYNVGIGNPKSVHEIQKDLANRKAEEETAAREYANSILVERGSFYFYRQKDSFVITLPGATNKIELQSGIPRPITIDGKNCHLTLVLTKSFIGRDATVDFFKVRLFINTTPVAVNSPRDLSARFTVSGTLDISYDALKAALNSSENDGGKVVVFAPAKIENGKATPQDLRILLANGHVLSAAIKDKFVDINPNYSGSNLPTMRNLRIVAYSQDLFSISISGQNRPVTSLPDLTLYHPIVIDLLR